MTDLSARPFSSEPESLHAAPTGPAGGALARVCLILAAVCLPLGLTLPVLETTRLWVFKESYSLIEAVQSLYETGEIALSLLIALFSLVTPIMKLGVVIMLHIRAPAPNSSLARWAERLGKWSLTDVLVIAVLIVVWSGTGLQVAVQAGLWFFAASAVLLMVGSGLAVRDLFARVSRQT
jgi:paraquat-inducible protein A